MEGTTSASSDLFEEGMWPEYCNPLYLMPDEIQVQVNTTQLDGKEHSYSFPVKIEKMSGDSATKYYYHHKHLFISLFVHHFRP